LLFRISNSSNFISLSDFNIDAINFSLVSGIDRFLIVKGEKYSVNIDNLLFNLKEMIK